MSPNGSMVRLIEPYKSNHWPVFGDGVMVATANTLAAEMDCPNCLAQLAPSGRLVIIEEGGLEDASTIRGDQGQVPGKGNELEGGQEEGGDDIQQPSSGETTDTVHPGGEGKEGKIDEETIKRED